jgi:hypothetical protein
MIRRPAIFALVAALVVGCGSDESSGPPSEQLTGTWAATVWRYTATSGGATVDLIATGSTGELKLDASGSGSLTRTPPGRASETRSFTWQRDGEFISFIYGPGNDDNFRVSLSGNVLTLTHNGSKSYDVNDDGTQESCNWLLQFTR